MSLLWTVDFWRFIFIEFAVEKKFHFIYFLKYDQTIIQKSYNFVNEMFLFLKTNLIPDTPEQYPNL